MHLHTYSTLSSATEKTGTAFKASGLCVSFSITQLLAEVKRECQPLATIFHMKGMTFIPDLKYTFEIFISIILQIIQSIR